MDKHLQQYKKVSEGPQLEPCMSLQKLKDDFGVGIEPDFGDADICGTFETQYFLREIYRKSFGYMLPSMELMERLVAATKKIAGAECCVLDAGSGSGYLSLKLTEYGIKTFAVDHFEVESITKVLHKRDAVGNAVDFANSEKFDLVLLIWPPYDKPFGFQVANAMRSGQWLIYEGEGEGGCNSLIRSKVMLLNFMKSSPRGLTRSM